MCVQMDCLHRLVGHGGHHELRPDGSLSPFSGLCSVAVIGAQDGLQRRSILHVGCERFDRGGNLDCQTLSNFPVKKIFCTTIMLYLLFFVHESIEVNFFLRNWDFNHGTPQLFTQHPRQERKYTTAQGLKCKILQVLESSPSFPSPTRNQAPPTCRSRGTDRRNRKRETLEMLYEPVVGIRSDHI
jgi:hypothetical protein